MIGRKREQNALEHWLNTGRPEFLVIYGRRRVGKTYLVEQFFRNRFAFRATGVSGAPRRTQLRVFHEKLVEYGDKSRRAPSDWFEAFSRLRAVLELPGVARDPVSGRRIVFIDEMPWFDTQRSDFRQALEYFWNDWGHTQDDLMLIACGSVTSWLTKNLLASTGGFYGRVTGRIGLQPMTLGECEELLRDNGIELTRQQVIELYLVFGGIPYYLNMVRRGLSPAQTVQSLCFDSGCPLEGELDLLFQSLFRGADAHLSLVRLLATKRDGLTNAELRKEGSLAGSSLTRALSDLCLAGFVQEFPSYGGGTYGKRYRVIDPFVNFSVKVIEGRGFDSWAAHVGTPSYFAWRGNAFELACLAHVPQIKAALGIAGVETTVTPWRSSGKGPKAQIDLVIDRKDGIIDLCEMKFTDAPYALDADEIAEMSRRRDVFGAETKSRKALHLALVSAAGVVRNAWTNSVQAVVTGDDLFG